MAPLAFINYRRSDAQHAAINLRAELNARFGAGSAFLDVGDIDPGSKWPERIREQLDRASVFLLVIGRNWLKAADEDGRRRLDLEGDWVRHEIQHALASAKPIIPVLVSEESKLPRRQALPDVLAGILDCQSICLRNESWERDIDALSQSLIDKYGFVEQPRAVVSDAPGTGPADARRYLTTLRERTAYIDIRGLQVGSGRAPRFPIEELYIPLTTSSAGGPATDAGGSDDPPSVELRAEQQGRPAGHIELREALRNSRLVIIGDPGAGKTTLLRRIAFAACNAALNRDDETLRGQLGFDRPVFPILLRVGDLIEHIAGAARRGDAPTTATSPGWIPNYLARLSDEADLGLGEAFFRERLESGEALVLLDGLDEAPNERQRRDIAELFEKTTERYATCRYVLTSRPAAFTDELVLPGFVHVEIDPLQDEAIEVFLRRWCQALFAENPADAERHLAELLDALRGRFEIRRMARNPVMLTALAVVHWNEKRLPEQRADLYESIITGLSRARMHRPGRSPPERCVGLLQDLALAMHDHTRGRQTQVSRRWAAEALAPYFREAPEDERQGAAERFLAEEELDSGIIVGRDDDVRFWHLTFQEYLAARSLAARSEKEQRRILLAQPRLYEPEWKETVLLMAGVLYHAGIDRVDRMIAIVLGQLKGHASLADQALCIGLLGAAVHDLSPMKYQPAHPRYTQLLNDVMRIFEPDWLTSARARYGGLWSSLITLVSPQRSDRTLMRLAIQAADVLGQIGVPRFVPQVLDESRVTIPAGRFLMGEYRDRDVHLDEFQIARYPVTVAQYRRFVDGDGYKDKRWWIDEFPKNSAPHAWEMQLEFPARPVVGVSWYEAQAYCAWTGARLPTEAEWVRAAGGKEGREFPWGNEAIEPTRANFFESNVGHPTPVGIYPLGATPEGICDLAGNVWEWCADWYGEYGNGPVANPRGPEAASFRVIRGGSWVYVAFFCRSAHRCGISPGFRTDSLGFRVARSPVQ